MEKFKLPMLHSKPLDLKNNIIRWQTVGTYVKGTLRYRLQVPALNFYPYIKIYLPYVLQFTAIKKKIGFITKKSKVGKQPTEASIVPTTCYRLLILAKVDKKNWGDHRSAVII